MLDPLRQGLVAVGAWAKSMQASHNVTVTPDRVEAHDFPLDVGFLAELGVEPAIIAQIGGVVGSVRVRTLTATRHGDGVMALAEFAGRLELAPDFALALTSLEITVDGGGVEARMQGAITLDGMEIGAEIALPQMTVSGWVAPADDADHGAILAARGFAGGGGSRPRLAMLTIDAAPALGAFAIYADIRDALHLGGDAFVAERLEIEAFYPGGLGAHPTGRAWSTLGLRIGDASVVIDVSAALGSEGWLFEGHVAAQAGLSLAALCKAIGGARPTMPGFIADCEIRTLSVAYDATGGGLTLGAALAWPTSGVDVSVTLTRAAGSLALSGVLQIDKAVFALSFVDDAAGPILLGSFAAAGGATLDLGDIVKAISGAPLAGAIPAALRVDVRAASLAAVATDKLAFGVTVDAGFDLGALSTLPLLGPLLPHDSSVGVVLGVGAMTAPPAAPWKQPELERVRGLAPPGSPLPLKPGAAPQIDIALKIGGEPARRIGMSLAASDATPPPAAAGAVASTPAADAGAEVTWIDVGRAFGPLHVARVGVHADATRREAGLLVDAALSAGGLTLGVDGLGVTYGLDDGAVGVAVRGLSLDFERGPVSFGGGFLNTGGDFAGRVTVRTEAFGLTALGAMTTIAGTPAMFIYGVLNYPLGGPPFFFVQGLAAGFGVNRSLTLPDIDAVESFPLVEDAIKRPGQVTGDPKTQLSRLHDLVAPRLGEHFLAVGVKFTCFKLIDGFALLVARQADSFEIDLLGVASYQTPPIVPTGVPALAKVKIDLIGRFAPAEGLIEVRARVADGSYVYSEMCRIFGDIAFSTWFAGPNAGDFVLSVGGYHPDFVRPSHYPEVSPAGMRFQVSDSVSLTGTCYFALTPQLFMAGGGLHGRAHIGSLEAWFDLSVDFLIGWEPNHYDAHVHVDIGARWKCFETEASADLHIWGPEFSGIASVSWSVFSFDVAFGAATPKGPSPIDWAHFRTSFLPADARDVCSCRAVAGLERSVAESGGERWVINPAEFVLGVDSLIPVGGVRFNGHDTGGAGFPARSGFGVAPMDVAEARSVLDIHLARRDEQGAFTDVALGLSGSGSPTAATAQVSLRPVAKTFPPALWGAGLASDMNAPLIEAAGGCEIRPHGPALKPTVAPFTRGEVAYSVHPTRRADAPAPVTRSTAMSGGAAELADALGLDPQSAAAKARAAVLASLGFPVDAVSLRSRLVEDLRGAPRAASVVFGAPS